MSSRQNPSPSRTYHFHHWIRPGSMGTVDRRRARARSRIVGAGEEPSETGRTLNSDIRRLRLRPRFRGRWSGGAPIAGAAPPVATGGRVQGHVRIFRSKSCARCKQKDMSRCIRRCQPARQLRRYREGMRSKLHGLCNDLAAGVFYYIQGNV